METVLNPQNTRELLHRLSGANRRFAEAYPGDRADRQPSDDTYPFGAVHYSDYPMLLAGSLKPGQDGQSVFLCYNCHGNGVIGFNRSNDLASSSNKFYAHPINDDRSHLLGDAEYDAAAWGNQLGNPGDRHASCLDCHVTHTAKRGRHAYITGRVSIPASSTACTRHGLVRSCEGKNRDPVVSGNSPPASWVSSPAVGETGPEPPLAAPLVERRPLGRST